MAIAQRQEPGISRTATDLQIRTPGITMDSNPSTLYSTLKATLVTEVFSVSSTRLK
jgi:hypothetical protein